jgi:hypothetical protein
MTRSPNVFRWNGRPGHYEVYYLTLTDPASGVGVWIRYTMTAPLAATGQVPSAALWFVAFDGPSVLARKQIFAIDALSAGRAPFELRVGGAVLTDHCYNTETASIRLHLYERAPRPGGWAHFATLRADGRAHFEYAQRTPVPHMELHLT